MRSVGGGWLDMMWRPPSIDIGRLQCRLGWLAVYRHQRAQASTKYLQVCRTTMLKVYVRLALSNRGAVSVNSGILNESEAMDWLRQMSTSAVSNGPLPEGGLWNIVDGPSLLAAASSLQLITANAHFLIRLQRLAAVAARLPVRESAPKLSSSAVRKLLTDPLVGGPNVRMQEDPFEGIYVTEVPFFGGARLVIEGTAKGSASAASSLISAVVGAPEGNFPSGYIVRMKAATAALLDLSDRVCRQAGLERGAVTLGADRNVTVPGAQRIAELSRYVQFRDTELWADLPTYVREYLSAKLIQSAADIPRWREGEIVDDGIIIKPLLRSGSYLYLASPGDLMASLRHLIIVESHEWGCSDELASALADVAFGEVRSMLRPISGAPLEAVESGQGYVRSVATFDCDKTLDVICLADDLTTYDQTSIYQSWRAPGLSERVHEVFESGASAPERTLRIVAYRGVGRDLAFGIPNSSTPAPTLFLPIEDLETILQSPGTDDMTLWYFAVAKERLEKHTHVVSFSEVDVFAFFRDHNESFYFDDRARPTMVNMEVGYGQKLRIDNYRRIDRHRIADPISGSLADAYAVHGRQSSPIYLVLGSSGASLVIEMDRAQVWVRVQSSDTEGSGTSAYEFGQAVAYWFWQILTSCPETLEQLHETGGLVEVQIASHVDSNEPLSNMPHSSEWITIETEDPRLLRLVFGNPPQPGGEAPPNFLDREIVRALVGALSAWKQGALAPSKPDGVLDRIAPPGHKQMIHVYGGDSDITLLPGHLPEARRVQPPAVAAVLDELGDYLTIELGLLPGLIRDDDRTGFLNERVTAWLIDRLAGVIEELNPDGLLEKLVALDEALISETAREPGQLRARLACFGASDDQVTKLQNYQSKAAESALASRFLVEYVTALPPSGQAQLTNEQYDHMLALGSEIISKGMLSDAIKHRISKAQISILESGRLGISSDDDRYHQALTHYGNSRARDTFEAAITAGLQDVAVTRVYSLEEANELAAIEFGFTFTDLTEACGQIIGLADRDGFKDVLVLDEEDVREVMKLNLGWDDEKVGLVLAAVILDARGTTTADFWKDGIQVFPWRFNRQLSYLRRPLLRIGQNGSTRIVTGRRRVWQTASYWFEQFQTGRLQAKTKPMKTALNKIRNAKGDSFELTVAARMVEAGLSRVRSRLSRVGPHDFRNIGGLDLGDIDAIGVDERNRIIYVVEAKDFEVARTPAELANEIDNLLLSDKAAIRRLDQRARWVRDHVPSTLTELGMKLPSGSWTVSPLVVVDERLLSARLSDSEIPILGISELIAHLQTDRDTLGRRKH